MSKYTTEVRFICETSAGLLESKGFDDINDILNKAVPKVFNFDFPIFDEDYRNPLCVKILRHYYTREICEETVGLWKLRLCNRLNEIMPYYNKLYLSELIEFDPMKDTDLKRTGNKKNDATGNLTKSDIGNKTATADREIDTTNNRSVSGDKNSTNEVDSTNKNSVTQDGTGTSENNVTKTDRDLYSDTPQGALTNIENETYLTNARKKTGTETNKDTTTNKVTSIGDTTYGETGKHDESYEETERGSANTEESSSQKENTTFSSNQNTKANTTEDYLENIIGKSGGVSYSKMLEDYRKTFLNIDKMVIEELSDLFFGLW